MSLLRKVDCVRLAVPDLDAGLAFYRDRLGHALKWRSETSAGLSLPESDAELVITTERPGRDTDFLVESVEEAAERFVSAGGEITEGPFEIAVGKCVVLLDPFGNPVVLLDLSKGRLETDAEGNVLGVRPR